MNGRLTAIKFGADTTEQLYRYFRNDGHDYYRQSQHSIAEKLSHFNIRLCHGNDDCTLTIDSFLPRHSCARFTLTSNRNQGVIVCLNEDLTPFMAACRAFEYETRLVNETYRHSPSELFEQRAGLNEFDIERQRAVSRIFDPFFKHPAFGDSMVIALDLVTKKYRAQQDQQMQMTSNDLFRRMVLK